ncbi:2-succinyl-5-enolpyruvyl-6-hydroxy-3-cyclohexene-1-carboxylic-acid synthase [Aestuariimicrobium ganziense]|uniref:2-succinyl-5-enolpyruvyl-6-hydroxy-3- cyclohexene-1-carboxylic-acid synthase n=1 Tax=Aestuariimicrobium ganziense TaxID=2773677 RepID=UPI0019420A85|nr:2-succinyl-5-enolpyruvyl-6-hydroxy-3-cyclohexene-1-carboxylic-acid synthase [Aestuariimicrobium ganziense]
MSSPVVARTVVAALRAAGVRDVVCSPGSRNGGLSLALAAAHARGDLRLHMVLDERGAGFLALGLAKGTSSTVAVVTTSGTAAANLTPAVAEAFHAGVRLLLVTADRPVSLHDSGANQTTRQWGLFGDLVVGRARIASDSGDEAAWAFVVRRAVALASGVRTGRPGPVHLNVELAEPLVDADLLGPLNDLPVEHQGLPGASAAYRLPTGPRTVVLVGDATPDLGRRARELAESARWPLLAEPSSGARTGQCAITGYRLLLDEAVGQEIERVVLAGHPTLSRPVTRLLRRPEVEVVLLADRALPDDPGQRAVVVADRFEAEPDDSDWLARWQAADAALDRLSGWSARSVAERVWQACRGQQLVVGSSNGIRHLDLAPVVDDPPLTWANRGLAGIDGTLHTAAGHALANDLPTTVLLGDLTFLHDLTGLVVGEGERRRPLRIVVLDDHGGAIFSGLEQGDAAYAEHFSRVFTTPQQVDVAEVARGLGAGVVEVSSLEELDVALGGELQRTTVVVCRLPAC